MSRFIRSTSIGLLCAVVFTILRGSWQDAPFVVPVFALSGFAISFVMLALIDLDWLETNRIAVLKKREVHILRDVVAAMIVVSAVYWSGPLIQGAGYSGWLLAIFFGITLPFIVCLVASRAVILFGLFTASEIMISTMMNHPHFRAADWLQFISRDITEWTIIWFILLVLSLIVSVPLAAQRSRNKALKQSDNLRIS